MKKMTAKRWLVLALVLVFVGFIGASLIQTDFGNVSITKLNFETEDGLTLSALLLTPDSATADTPAPAIVTVHGWYNNKEMQDLNYVELARRGFVVLAIDQYSHGDSDNADVGFENYSGNGLYYAVKEIAKLNYVDKTRIGVTGHSYGAECCKSAVERDKEADEQLISAVLLVCADSVYTPSNPMTNMPRCVYDPYSDEAGFFNFWGNRDVGIVAAQYDEFYHGYPDDTAANSTAPRDYIHQPTAQSFLYFGVDPEGKTERSAYEYYYETVDGEDCFHVIYNPDIIHPQAHWNIGVEKSVIEFFTESLDAPNPISSSNQTWPIKCAFNGISLIGFFMFIVSLAIYLLDKPYFAALKAEREVARLEAPKSGLGKFWFWGGMVLAMLFGMIAYLKMHDPIQNLYPNLYNPTAHGYSFFFNQFPTLFIGCWSAVCGCFLVLLMFLSYKTYGKNNGMDLAVRGVKISLSKLWKTIVLAVTVVAAGYGLIFFGDWAFLTDARVWILTVRAFGAAKFAVIWKYLIFFLIYFVAMSVSVNCFNYNKVGKPWVNTLIQCVSVGLGPVLLVALQYGFFKSSGYMFTEYYHICGSIVGIWLFPIIVYLPLAAFVSRTIYKKTGNPYIGGIIMGILLTIINCTNTLTFG